MKPAPTRPIRTRVLLRSRARLGILALLDQGLQVFLQCMRRVLGTDLSQQRGVELVLHLQGHVRVVWSDGPRKGVLQSRFGEGDYGDALLDLGVIVELRSGWQIRTFYRPEPLLLGRGEELYELPRGIGVLGAGADVEWLVAHSTVARLAVGRWQLGHSDLLRIQFRVVRGADQGVHVGPVAQEDGVAVQEGPGRLVLLVHRHRLGRDAVGDHAPLRGETRYGIGTVHDNPVRVRGIQYVTAVTPDELAAVAHPALVPGALEDEPVLGAG